MADLSQDELDQLDSLLEKLYFSGAPEYVRHPVWDLHGRLKHSGLTERRWTVPEVET